MAKRVRYTIRKYVKGDEIALARNSSECFGPVTPRRLMEWYRRNGVQPEDIFVGSASRTLRSFARMFRRKDVANFVALGRQNRIVGYVHAVFEKRNRTARSPISHNRESLFEYFA